MTPFTISLIITEHPSFLTETRRERYGNLAASISDISGYRVSSWHYLDCNEATLQSKALVLSGSHAPWDAHRQSDLQAFGQLIRSFAGPIFGICAGMQLLATAAGASLRPCRQIETGFTSVEVDTEADLFVGVSQRIHVFQQHSDEVSDLPDSVRVIARNDSCEVQALAVPERRWWGTQFHPELADDLHPAGRHILKRAMDLMLPEETAETARQPGTSEACPSSEQHQ